MASEARRVCRWPYAASSTGRYLGHIKLHILKGRVGCWEAVGQAREEFSNIIGPKLAACIENNSDRLADSEILINFALFMIGSSPQHTKPTIMFVSRDKYARLEARKAVKESGMLAAYPGFETGHCSQVAEFRDLRQFGGYDERCGQTVYSRGGRVAEGTLLFLSSGDANDNDEPAPRAIATVGGLLSFGQQYFLLTVAHRLRHGQSTLSKAENRGDSNTDSTGEDEEDECEISGLEFSEDEDEPLVDVTSRGSLTPEAGGLLDGGDAADGDPMSCSSEEEGGHFESGSKQVPLAEGVGTPQDYNADIYRDASRDDGLERIGVTDYFSFELDYALIRLDSSIIRSLSMPLSAHKLDKPSTWNLGGGPRDCSTTLRRRDGQLVRGSISGNPAFTRLPGTKKFSRLYAATLEQHLSPGDCGAWVRDSKTGALFGHVVAGSDATGLALVMPAQLCFDDIIATLATRLSSDNGDAEARVQQNQKPPKSPGEPQPKGGCRYILLPAVRGQRCTCVAYTHNAAVPGAACECGHLACFHTREETSAQVGDLEALKTRLAHLESVLAVDSIARFAERLSLLEDHIEKLREEFEEQIKGVYKHASVSWRGIEQMERKVATFEGRLGEMSGKLGKLSEENSETHQRVENLTQLGPAPENDSVVKIKRLPAPASGLVAIGRGAWTAHISLLPHGHLPAPFERNTNAYQRCLSRGLHQMVVVHGPDAESFSRAVETTFGTFLKGRPWLPLQAQLCSAEQLRELPMLRQLPPDLEKQPFTAAFLREHCALCDQGGRIDSIYIAMKSDTLSWHTLRRSPVFMEGLEGCWAFDPLLDGGDPFNSDALNDVDRPAAAGYLSLTTSTPALSEAPTRRTQQEYGPLDGVRQHLRARTEETQGRNLAS